MSRDRDDARAEPVVILTPKGRTLLASAGARARP